MRFEVGVPIVIAEPKGRIGSAFDDFLKDEGISRNCSSRFDCLSGLRIILRGLLESFRLFLGIPSRLRFLG